MTTTYLASVVVDQLDQAQAVIERHLVACNKCGTNAPCHERMVAGQVFARYGRLPHRTPGLTRQGPAGDMPSDSFRSKQWQWTRLSTLRGGTLRENESDVSASTSNPRSSRVSASFVIVPAVIRAEKP